MAKELRVFFFLALLSDMVTAPQPLGPLGPMAEGHLMTTETPDVDLILSQALKMNMRAAQSHYDSRVNNTTLGLRCESMASGNNQT